MRKITTQDRQCPLDIALQEYGSPEGVTQLLLDNPVLTRIDQPIPAGTIIVISDLVYNKIVRDKYTDTGKKIVSLTIEEQLLFGDFNDDFNIDFN